jgi:hypothetical protein
LIVLKLVDHMIFSRRRAFLCGRKSVTSVETAGNTACRLHPKVMNLSAPRAALGFAPALAFLIGNGAGGFACGLAGGLAFAAATPGGSLSEISFVDGFNMFHKASPSHRRFFFYHTRKWQINQHRTQAKIRIPL